MVLIYLGQIKCAQMQLDDALNRPKWCYVIQKNVPCTTGRVMGREGLEGIFHREGGFDVRKKIYYLLSTIA